ncbi:hypothetical protein AFCA_001773 [Aspergillus flavus]|nr:uncharacterized protein G4B84_001628 [Aspergillus flavus NRRL3357]QMW26383.1 hypothetical protein G4B84_001628 [Aspergillus flavus NRRL3357]UCK58938.1 hypothetical protein AFCA_001773 [Aspergillus flavus]
MPRRYRKHQRKVKGSFVSWPRLLPNYTPLMNEPSRNTSELQFCRLAFQYTYLSYAPADADIIGCYECSQRRINCDRAEPQCAKCVSRGLECSGLGIRLRFSNYAAIRGNWVGKTMDDVYAGQRHPRPETDNTRSPLQVGTPVSFAAILNAASLPTAVEQVPEARRVPIYADKYGGTAQAGRPQDALEAGLSVLGLWDNFRAPIMDFWDGDLISSQSSTATIRPVLSQPAPDGVRPWEEMLMLYFSQRIAKEMVAIDGLHNGWIHIVLPLARTNELVLDAILAVSSFHLFANAPREAGKEEHPLQTEKWNPPICKHRAFTIAAVPLRSEDLYLRAIHGLQARQDIAACGNEEQRAVLLAILVLQIVVMVTGSDDFPLLFRMMESVLKAIGGEERLGKGELSWFMRRHIHKMRVYGAPFLSENDGLETLSSEHRFLQMFDCLHYCAQQRPDASANVPVIKSLVRQAHRIYLRQAAGHANNSLKSCICGTPTLPLRLDTQVVQEEAPPAPLPCECIALVQQYKETLETLPPGSIGEEVLTWATFIAASDCILTEHMAFFEDVFLRYHARSGFANVLTGLEYLRRIWKGKRAGGGGLRWTAVLPQMRVIIM